MSTPSGIFPGLGAIPENADIFAAQEFFDSMSFSIQPDTSAAISGATPLYNVMGSNKSTNAGDMVAVIDDQGNSGARPLSQAFSGIHFPFKFIGIQFSANGDIGAGTVTFYFNQKAQRTNLA